MTDDAMTNAQRIDRLERIFQEVIRGVRNNPEHQDGLISFLEEVAKTLFGGEEDAGPGTTDTKRH
jgi:hypothetical protein